MAEFDLEIEDINPILDLVYFENIEAIYRSDRPLSLVYNLGKEFKPSKGDDWIGIFREGWDSVNDYLAYRWASTKRYSRKEPNRRTVLFTEYQLKDCVNDVDSYQFLYITKCGNVVGVSDSFKFNNDDYFTSPMELPVRNSSSISFEKVFADYSELNDSSFSGYDFDLCFDELEHCVMMSSKNKEQPEVSKEKWTSLDSEVNRKRTPLPGYDFDLCFDELEHCVMTSSKNKEQPEVSKSMDSEVNRKRNLPDTEQAPEVRKKGKPKQKVLTVVRDTDSLIVDFPAKPWSEKLRIVQQVVHPIVQEYISNKERAVLPFTQPLQPVYDVTQTQKVNKGTVMGMANAQPPKLEFPIRLSLLPGPQSILGGMKHNSKSCNTCAFGSELLSEYIKLDKITSEKMEDMDKEIKDLKANIKDNAMKNLMTTFQKVGGSDSRKGQCEELKKQNKKLRSTVAKLQKQIKLLEQEKKEEEKKPKEKTRKEDPVDKHLYNQDECTKDAVLILSKQGYKAVVDADGNRVEFDKFDTTRSSSSDDDDDDGLWHIKSPRRIERLRNVITKQDMMLENANFAMATQRTVIKKKTKLVKSLRKNSVALESRNEELTKRLCDMTFRIKDILRGRAKEYTNEWRILARQIREEPYLETAEKENKETKAVMKNPDKPEPKEPKQVSRGTQLHSRNMDLKYNKSSLTKTCPQCFVNFSPDVDPHVYEEHMMFHERYPKKYN